MHNCALLQAQAMANQYYVYALALRICFLEITSHFRFGACFAKNCGHVSRSAHSADSAASARTATVANDIFYTFVCCLHGSRWP